jgi:hypothetical protein
MDVFNGLGVKIQLKTDDDFLKVKETLTRMGVESRRDNTLFQSCHILHKRGQYAIMHFKELFSLDGKESTLNEEDIKRRNKIACLLAEWNLVDIDTNQNLEYNGVSLKIIPFSQKKEWELKSKYRIGQPKK